MNSTKANDSSNHGDRMQEQRQPQRKLNHPIAQRRIVVLATLCSFLFLCMLGGVSWRQHRRNVEGHSSNEVGDGFQWFDEGAGMQTRTQPTAHTSLDSTPLLQQQQQQQQNSTRAYRTGDTIYDRFYTKHKTLPDPKVVHGVLSLASDTNHRVLIVGDIHGCLDELKLLVDECVALQNGGMPFHAIVLVGDLINKGPYSLQVLQYVRRRQQQQEQRGATQWHVVRGNHEAMVLEVALQHGQMHDPKTKKKLKKKFAWMFDDEQASTLSDDDIAWLAELPYTLTIPPAVLFRDSSSGMYRDTPNYTIVHGGFLPHVPIHKQSTETMITIRDVKRVPEQSNVYKAVSKEESKQRRKKKHKSQYPSWAQEWIQEPHVIFGHDAHRGLQQYEYATGIDTGVVYGRQLTGLILPEGVLHSLDALQVYST